MANERELKLKITGDSSAAEKAVKKLETALQKAQEELEKAKTEADRADGQVEDLGQSADRAGREVDQLGDKASTTGRQVDDLGDKGDQAGEQLVNLGDGIGDMAKGQLGPLGDAADMAGINLEGLNPKAMAAAGGLGFLAKTMLDGIEAWGQYTHEVEQYSYAAGVSTEEASRFASVFKQFGLEADDGIDALKTLGEEAGDAPEKFRQYNIEIARARDGGVDMTATLANVADRFRQIRDPAERAAMGAALFGDNWLRIAPILDRGSDGIAELLANVDESAIVTKEALREQREFEQSVRDLTLAWQQFSMSLGREALPRLTLLAKDLGVAAEWVEKLTGGMFGLNDVMGIFNPLAALYDTRIKAANESQEAAARSMTDLADKMASAAVVAGEAGAKQRDLAVAEKEAADRADEQRRRQEEMTRASKDAVTAIDEQRRKLDELTATIFSMAGTDLAVEQANIALGESMDRLVEKQTAVTDAVNQYGQDSPQATTAARDYEKAVIDTRGAADRLAKSQVEQAKQQAAAAGQTLTDAESVAIYRGSIESTRDATNDPTLKAGLDTMATKIGVTADEAARARDRLNEATEAAANLAAQGIGERAASIARGIIARSPSAGFSQQRSDGAQAAPTQNTTINVTAQTNANPWDIAAQVDWALRTGGR
ncbi:MAG: phage tail tape measure protein [Geminicoccaceae bacterium]